MTIPYIFNNTYLFPIGTGKLNIAVIILSNIKEDINGVSEKQKSSVPRIYRRKSICL